MPLVQSLPANSSRLRRCRCFILFVGVRLRPPPTRPSGPRRCCAADQPAQDIFICGRMDLHSQRHFDGAISHLSFFDHALSAEEVRQLYEDIDQHR